MIGLNNVIVNLLIPHIDNGNLLHCYITPGRCSAIAQNDKMLSFQNYL